MKLFTGAILLICLAFGQAWVDKWERLNVTLTQLAEEMKHNATLRQMWLDHLKHFEEKETRAFPHPFRCHLDLLPHETPDSVHELRMEDFKVIGAMGDSLTAANGAKALTVIGVLTEYRGVAWSIGGDGSLDSGSVTLANLLRKYNPNIRGYSVGSGSVTSSGSHLNVAHPGDTAHDMPAQADLLIQRIKADHHINFQQDWKLVTMFIGGNDLCDVCHTPDKHSPANYINNIKIALDKLHAGLPRTFVNLAMIFDITPVASLGHNNFFCNVVHGMVCDCGQDKQHHAIVQANLVEYQRLTQELIDSGRYDNGRNDFTVVLQPFYRDTVPPHKDNGGHDLSYFAPDCFHFSTKGHQVAAVSIFNNMVEPVGHKNTKWHLNEPYLCPGQHQHHVNDFIPTYKNHKAHVVGK
ncbi:phospholipase B1, membrane-associated-like [Liolophura sinensis]|uniref:phospholipase B1, membrane-associated-like n=1 Tax=Liolophura sinensis TaxID=3198878 RepID=UPI0031587F60